MNKRLKIEQITFSKYKDLASLHDMPLWAKHECIQFYPTVLILAAYLNGNLIALWPLPIGIDKKIERPYRLLPYHAPVIFNTHNHIRRKIVESLFLHICSYSDYISIPLSPSFNDFPIIASHGALIECRHSHVADRDWLKNGIDRSLRNNFNKAIGTAKTSLVDVAEFCFDRAIIGENNFGVSKRIEMAKTLYQNNFGFCLRAVNKDGVLGEVFIAKDNSTAYLLHSWFDKGKVRGIPTLLIIQSMEIAFTDSKIQTFDFEGSVIPSVDEFFSSFGCKIVSYPYVHWHADLNVLFHELKNTIFASERLIST